MSLISVEKVTVQIPTDLPETTIKAIIDREEAEIVRRFGSNWSAALSLTENQNGGTPYVFVDRPIETIASITESGDNFTTSNLLVAAEWREVGSSAGEIERLNRGMPINFQRDVRIIYSPVDDTLERQAVMIELVRIALERQVMAKETVGGEYSYQSPEWREIRRDLHSNLQHFVAV